MTSNAACNVEDVHYHSSSVCPNEIPRQPPVSDDDVYICKICGKSFRLDESQWESFERAKAIRKHWREDDEYDPDERYRMAVLLGLLWLAWKIWG